MRPNNKPQNPNIDFSKVISTDDLDDSLDTIRGVCSLLNALELTNDAGSHPYNKHAYYALQVVLHHGIEELEAFKPRLEYMDNFMRYETINKEIKKWVNL